MDGLTFVSNLIDSLAWPVAAAVVFIFIVRNLGAIRAQVETLRFKDVEIKFRKAISELKEEAVEQSVTVVMPRGAAADAQLQLSQTNPELFVLDQWAHIETLLVDWERRRSIGGGSRNPKVILDAALAAGAISAPTYQIARQILDVRNTAAHAENLRITEGEAAEFLGLVTSIRERLLQGLSESGAPPPPPPPSIG